MYTNVGEALTRAGGQENWERAKLELGRVLLSPKAGIVEALESRGMLVRVLRELHEDSAADNECVLHSTSECQELADSYD